MCLNVISDFHQVIRFHFLQKNSETTEYFFKKMKGRAIYKRMLALYLVHTNDTLMEAQHGCRLSHGPTESQGNYLRVTII